MGVNIRVRGEVHQPLISVYVISRGGREAMATSERWKLIADSEAAAVTAPRRFDAQTKWEIRHLDKAEQLKKKILVR